MRRQHPCILALLTLLTLFAASTAQAQQPTTGGSTTFVTPKEGQIELYQASTEQYNQKNYSEAINLLKSSLALGELNILYLNLGLAYFKDGQCDEAQDAFSKALTAPKIAEPSPEVIAAKVKESQAEMAGGCPGTVEVTCIPASMTISVDGAAPVACTEALKLMPGEHVITGADGKLSATTRVTVASRQSQRVTLDATPKVEAGSGGNTMATVGYITAGSGLLIVTAGALVDLLVLSPAIGEYSDAVEEGSSDEQTLRDDAESLQSTVLALYIAGGVGVVAGATLIALGLSGGQDEASASTIEPWITPDGGAGMGWSVTW